VGSNPTPSAKRHAAHSSVLAVWLTSSIAGRLQATGDDEGPAPSSSMNRNYDLSSVVFSESDALCLADGSSRLGSLNKSRPN
jgi:hypothetical protein